MVSQDGALQRGALSFDSSLLMIFESRWYPSRSRCKWSCLKSNGFRSFPFNQSSWGGMKVKLLLLRRYWFTSWLAVLFEEVGDSSLGRSPRTNTLAPCERWRTTSQSFSMPLATSIAESLVLLVPIKINAALKLFGSSPFSILQIAFSTLSPPIDKFRTSAKFVW